MLKPNEMLRIKREALGMTQAEFGAVVGCTAGTISGFEQGKEVTELVFKGINWAIKDLESKLTPEEFNDYKLRTGCEIAIAEQNPKLKMAKLHTLMYNTLKYLQYLEQKERGDFKSPLFFFL